MKITVIGLGSGGLSGISYGALQAIQSTNKLYLRTERHPIVEYFSSNSIVYESFDHLYETSGSFEEVYRFVVDALLDAAEKYREIVYAVPGHPRVAETSIEMLMEDPRLLQKKIEIDVIPSGSFIDDMFIFLDLDPSKNGFTLLDALQFDIQSIYSPTDLVFTQVFSRKIASDLKLRLLEHFCDDARVVLFKAAGVDGMEQRVDLRLYEVDQCSFEFDHLTSLWVPSCAERYRFRTLFDLIHTMERLRSKDGCPWDKKQTPTSVLSNMREELEELIEAIQNEDIDNIVEELGDVLMLIAMQAQFGAEYEYFNMFDVIDGIVKKLIFRHPHVFGDAKISSLEEANEVWRQQKIAEKNKH